GPLIRPNRFPTGRGAVITYASIPAPPLLSAAYGRPLRRRRGAGTRNSGGHPMSGRRIKACLMTAAVVALLGVVTTDVPGFGGKLFGKKGGDCCADACASPCGPGGAGMGAGGPYGSGGMGAGGAGMGPGGGCGSWVTQKQMVTEYVQQMVDQTVTVMQQQ